MAEGCAIFYTLSIIALQQFDDAKVFYNRVLEIEPWNADARQNLETLESKRQAV